MIEISKVEWFNIEGAIRGVRNPMNSWAKSDSKGNEIGPNDLDLCKRLIKGGSEHRKFLRQIFISMDINAPMYWWSEFDTYKVGTVANSCSKMHKLLARPFTVEDFSFDHTLGYKNKYANIANVYENHCKPLIDTLNKFRDLYLNTEEPETKKEIWYSILQLLPNSYNQLRTITMNYENALNILHQRSHHKLDEWKVLCTELRTLPYIKEFEEAMKG